MALPLDSPPRYPVIIAGTLYDHGIVMLEPCDSTMIVFLFSALIDSIKFI